MAKEKSDLGKFKKEYLKIQKKHNLPSFKELNEDFQIEKASEFETDFVLREIRKLMADKFSNYLRFVEAILNPINAPMFVFTVVKAIGNDEKNKLAEIYKKLVRIEVKIIDVDVEFSEKKEAEFIKESYKLWQGIKKDILDIVNSINKNWDNKLKGNDKGYFG